MEPRCRLLPFSNERHLQRTNHAGTNSPCRGVAAAGACARTGEELPSGAHSPLRKGSVRRRISPGAATETYLAGVWQTRGCERYAGPIAASFVRRTRMGTHPKGRPVCAEDFAIGRRVAPGGSLFARPKRLG